MSQNNPDVTVGKCTAMGSVKRCQRWKLAAMHMHGHCARVGMCICCFCMIGRRVVYLGVNLLSSGATVTGYLAL